VLLPCDFIPPPSLSLTPLLNKFRTDVVTDGSIATACWFEVQQPDKGTLIDEWGHLASPIPIVWEDSTGTLLHVDSQEVDNHAEDVELRMALLTQQVGRTCVCA
jgi:translation initiation factor eIF-2B subunit gamma